MQNEKSAVREGSRIFLKIIKLISEHSQNTTKTLFWTEKLRRRQIFEKQIKKTVFRHFLKNSDLKTAFFGGVKMVFIKSLGLVGPK